MTPSRRFHLAQANVANMRAPLEDPIMEGFRSQLDRINALADASPGFVWRLQTDSGNATDIRAFENELILFNMSVWESIEALHAYVYRSGAKPDADLGPDWVDVDAWNPEPPAEAWLRTLRHLASMAHAASD